VIDWSNRSSRICVLFPKI